MIEKRPKIYEVEALECFHIKSSTNLDALMLFILSTPKWGEL